MSLLSFDKVSFSYTSQKKVLNDISFKIKDGEKVALLGLNGAGKSTLMLHTNGLLFPDEGEVSVKGISTKSKDLKFIRQKVGIVFQNADDQLFMPTVKDDVAFGPRNMKLSEEEINQRVEEALRLTNTIEISELPPYDLSGGQKKSVSIATVLSMRPELLVMDEPTSGLDYEAICNFINIIKNLDSTLLLSTHDTIVARQICERAILLEKGRIIYDGDITKLQYPPL